jgi:hypothetical protein
LGHEEPRRNVKQSILLENFRGKKGFSDSKIRLLAVDEKKFAFFPILLSTFSP